jgi:thioredoxin 1/thioredoxin 2
MKYVIVILVFVLAVAVVHSRKGKFGAQNPDIQQVVQSSDKKLLLVFWKPHCPGCERTEPMVAQLEKEYPAFQVLRINTDLKENRPIHDQYGIQGTPTLIVVEKGKVLGKNEGGFLTTQELVSFVRPSYAY